MPPVGQFFFSFRGRINRWQFWLHHALTGWLILIVVSSSTGRTATIFEDAVDLFGSWLVFGSVGGAVLQLLRACTEEAQLAGLAAPVLWTVLAAAAKRWHDRGKSAWWGLFGLLPVVGGYWTLLELTLGPGAERTNRHGPRPTWRRIWAEDLASWLGEEELQRLTFKSAQRLRGVPSVDRPALYELLEVTQYRTALFEDLEDRCWTGLIRLASRRRRWVRPADTWRPESGTGHDLFSSLANHLLVRYPLPVFMASAWLREDSGARAHRELFLHVGNGKSLRTGRTPVALTARAAHHFLQAPDDYSIEAAVRWGQVAALGGSSGLADAFRQTRLAERFDQETLAMSVLEWFVAHPRVGLDSLGPIVEYYVNQPPGALTRKRSPASVLGKLRWPASGIAEMIAQVGTDDGMPKVLTVVELLSREALVREGRQMRNCIAQYATHCEAGRCSIWSLRLTAGDRVLERQTVEVNGTREIIQSLGIGNAWPTERARAMLQLWATVAGLTVGVE